MTGSQGTESLKKPYDKWFQNGDNLSQVPITTPLGSPFSCGLYSHRICFCQWNKSEMTQAAILKTTVHQG